VTPMTPRLEDNDKNLHATSKHRVKIMALLEEHLIVIRPITDLSDNDGKGLVKYKGDWDDASIALAAGKDSTNGMEPYYPPQASVRRIRSQYFGLTSEPAGSKWAAINNAAREEAAAGRLASLRAADGRGRHRAQSEPSTYRDEARDLEIADLKAANAILLSRLDDLERRRGEDVHYNKQFIDRFNKLLQQLDISQTAHVKHLMLPQHTNGAGH
jgi:hypothetical protein